MSFTVPTHLALVLVIFSCCAANHQLVAAQDDFNVVEDYRLGDFRTFWEVLALNPYAYAARETCSRLGTSCSPTNPETCCSKWCIYGDCCLPDGATCNYDEQCCSGTCFPGTPRVCGQPCFSGGTMVNVLGVKEPVQMRDLQTGQKIQCLDTNTDMRVPINTTWCEVLNFVHAEETAIEHYHISFSSSAGSSGRRRAVTGSMAVTGQHMMMKLTGAVNDGDIRPTVDAFGDFAEVGARYLQVGDKMAMLVDRNDLTAGFIVVTISSIEQKDTAGLYVPGVSKPYIIADGIVTPLWLNGFYEVVAPEGYSGAKLACAHYFLSPIFMNRWQPVGVAGKDAQWPSAGGDPSWPDGAIIRAARATYTSQGLALNFTAFSEWFVPRYAEWEQDASKAVSVDEVVAAFALPGVWVKPPPAGGSSSPGRRTKWTLFPMDGSKC